MTTNTKRQQKHHDAMLKAGYKKRSFYLSEKSLEKLAKYKERSGLKNLNEVLEEIIDELN